MSTVVLGVCLLRGALAWIPGSGARRWAFGLALHAALGVVSIALLPRALPAPAQLLTASSLLGCEILYLLTLVNFAPPAVGFSEI